MSDECSVEESYEFSYCVNDHSFCYNLLPCWNGHKYYSLRNETFTRGCDNLEDSHPSSACIEFCSSRASNDSLPTCHPLNEEVLSITKTRVEAVDLNNSHAHLSCPNGLISVRWGHINIESGDPSGNLNPEYCSLRLTNSVAMVCNDKPNCTFDFSTGFHSLMETCTAAVLPIHTMEIGALCTNVVYSEALEEDDDTCYTEAQVLLVLLMSIVTTFLFFVLLSVASYLIYRKYSRRKRTNRWHTTNKEPLSRPGEAGITSQYQPPGMPGGRTRGESQSLKMDTNLSMFSPDGDPGNPNTLASGSIQDRHNIPKLPTGIVNIPLASNGMYVDTSAIASHLHPHGNASLTASPTNLHSSIAPKLLYPQNPSYYPSSTPIGIGGMYLGQPEQKMNHEFLSQHEKPDIIAALTNPSWHGDDQANETQLPADLNELKEIREIQYGDMYFEAETGIGSYGKVFRVRWFDHEVAAKRFRKEDVDEAKALQFIEQLKPVVEDEPHPHVLRLYGYCTHPSFCLVTEFIAGESVKDYLKHDRPQSSKISVLDRLIIAKQAAEGVQYLHSKNILHRDIAARNLLIRGSDSMPGINVVVGDYGITTILNEELYAETYTTIGPLKWMAPEAISDFQFSKKSDSYAFGITLWELLTGQDPYPDIDPVNTAVEVLVKERRPNLYDFIPAPIKKLMKRCWDTNKDKRPEFSEIVRKLDKFIANNSDDTL